jgi:hypothetical protein
MSDPRYTDPRTGATPERVSPGSDDTGAIEASRRQRLGELNRSNAMWAWIAGGVVLALLIVFVFGSSSTTDQANNQMTAPPPGQTTLSPPANPPRTPPATTGQNNAQ